MNLTIDKYNEYAGLINQAKYLKWVDLNLVEMFQSISLPTFGVEWVIFDKIANLSLVINLLDPFFNSIDDLDSDDNLKIDEPFDSATIDINNYSHFPTSFLIEIEAVSGNSTNELSVSLVGLNRSITITDPNFGLVYNKIFIDTKGLAWAVTPQGGKINLRNRFSVFSGFFEVPTGTSTLEVIASNNVVVNNIIVRSKTLFS